MAATRREKGARTRSPRLNWANEVYDRMSYGDAGRASRRAGISALRRWLGGGERCLVSLSGLPRNRHGAPQGCNCVFGSASRALRSPCCAVLCCAMRPIRVPQIKQVLATASGPSPAGGSSAPLWGSLEEPPDSAAAAATLVLSPMQRAILVTMQTDPGEPRGGIPGGPVARGVKG